MHERSKLGSSIVVDCWRLDSASRTAVFASFDKNVPALVHYGRSLPVHEKLETLARLSTPNVASGQSDPIVPLTLVPSAIDGWRGHPGIIMRNEFGVEIIPDWKITTPQELPGNKLHWTALSSANNSNQKLQITVALDDAGILTLETDLTHEPSTRVAWLPAGAIPVPAHMPRIIDHGGRWTGEFQKQERRFTIGQHMRESREGRTGHADFPGMIFAADACDETTGECMGVTLCWSGGHTILAEEIPDGRRQVQANISAATSNSSRKMKVAWSDIGLNGLSNAFHTVPRVFSAEKLKTRTIQRPVHYNCWEAVYFRHSVDELKEIATKAAALGAERFVLDDGWFKGRNDDTTSLGDWTVDPDKFPDGLKPLTDHIHAEGMQFGIWFEPEMINIDSDLYRAHPEWVHGPLEQPSGRDQFVLDLSKEGVCDYLFDAIAAILAEYPVTYIKWDHNRILTGEAPQQTAALYSLLGRLNQEFPDVEIESCASGGARIDYGILNHTTRVWLSDSNDALERLRMQYEASRWIPPEIQGSHVGPRLCHSSGRIIPIAFRAWVSASRHMGIEMDPRELTPDEADTLKNTIDWYKTNRDHLFSATHHRLNSNDPQIFAEMFVAQDKSRFTLFRGQADASAQIASRPMQLAALDADRTYEVRLLNPGDVVGVLNKNAANNLKSGQAVQLSGAALMAGAMRTPNAYPMTMHVFEGKAL